MCKKAIESLRAKIQSASLHKNVNDPACNISLWMLKFFMWRILFYLEPHSLFSLVRGVKDQRDRVRAERRPGSPGPDLEQITLALLREERAPSSTRFKTSKSKKEPHAIIICTIRNWHFYLPKLGLIWISQTPTMINKEGGGPRIFSQQRKGRVGGQENA